MFRQLPWPLTPFALVPLLLAAWASATTPGGPSNHLQLQLLTQLPLTFSLAVLLALLHLGAALARSGSSTRSNSSSSIGVRTRRQSLNAADGSSSSLQRAFVRLLLDVVALAVLAQGVAYLLLLRGYVRA